MINTILPQAYADAILSEDDNDFDTAIAFLINSKKCGLLLLYHEVKRIYSINKIDKYILQIRDGTLVRLIKKCLWEQLNSSYYNKYDYSNLSIELIEETIKNYLANKK